MSNNYSAQGLTGKSHRKMVDVPRCHLIAPLVAEAHVVKDTHVINDATKSGKQKGALIILGDSGGRDKFAVAAGSKEQDVWKTVALAAVRVVTPA